jgi:hypothetical protein
LAGGFFETYTSNIASTLSQIQFASDSTFLVGLDSQGRIIRVNGADGLAVVLSDANLIGRNMRLSPNDAFVMSEAENTGDATHRHIVFEPVAISASQQTDSISLNEVAVVLNHDVEWVDDDTIIDLFHYFADESDPSTESYDGQLIELVTNLTSGATTLNIIGGTLFIDSPTTMVLRNPRTTPGSLGALFSLEREQADGSFNLMRSDFTFTQTTLVGGGFGHNTLSDSHWTADGAFLIFEAQFGAGADTFNVIASYEAATGTTSALTLGQNPSPSPTDTNIVGYLSEDITGELQVSVLNLDFY